MTKRLTPPTYPISASSYFFHSIGRNFTFSIGNRKAVYYIETEPMYARPSSVKLLPSVVI
jgi:hypothetical protein